MKKEDFKFTDVFAFEEGYLKRQSELPEEERDHPRRKFDFSGQFGSGTENQIRAEDIAIIRELMTCLYSPLVGLREDDSDEVKAGWDPYLWLGGDMQAARCPHDILARDPDREFKGDDSYTLADGRTMTSGRAPGSWRFLNRKGNGMSDLDSYGVVNGLPSAYYHWDGPRGDVPMTKGGAYAESLLAGGGLDYPVTRLDLWSLLMRAAMTCVDPDKDVPDGWWHDDTSWPVVWLTYEKGQVTKRIDSEETDGEYGADKSKTTKLGEDMLQSAKSFRVVPDDVADAVWEATRTPGDGGQPRLSRTNVTSIGNALVGLEFTRQFDVSRNGDAGMRTDKTWRRRLCSEIGVRWTSGAKATSFHSAGGSRPEKSSQKHEDDGTWTFTVEEGEFSPSGPDDEYEPESMYSFGAQYSMRTVYKANRYQTRGQEGFISGTCTVSFDTWHDHKPSASLEVSTPAGIPKCVEVTGVTLVFTCNTCGYKVITSSSDAPVPNLDYDDSRCVDSYIPVKVSVLERDDGSWGGTVSASELLNACPIEHDKVVPEGYAIGAIYYNIAFAEVSFKLRIPS